jgi:hypothetical protein
MLRMASRGRCADRLLTEDGHTSVHGTSASPIEAALANTSRIPGALLWSDNYGSRLERAAKLHPLWRSLSAYQASDAVPARARSCDMTADVPCGAAWLLQVKVEGAAL